MASACVNNISMSPESFSAAKYTSYGWFSPRVSFSHEFPEEDGSSSAAVAKPKPQAPPPPPQVAATPKVPEVSDPEPSAGDFEFRLEDPVAMLPADELFSDGKLVPLHLSSLKPSVGAFSSPGIESPDALKACRIAELSNVDPFLYSPKAPRCSSRWRELLGLKKLYQNSSTATGHNQKTSESLKTSSSSSNTKSFKNFLHRSSKSSSSSSSDAYLSLPLLRDSDCESLSISSSRLSLSSSSSGHEHDDLPRLSLDSEKTAPNPFKAPNPNPPRMRLVRPTTSNGASTTTNSARVGRSPMRRTSDSSATVSRGVSVDSPRMNSSGKIVFQSLERSSSSPSSFNGGPRFKHRGMERSYSANVRVTPVLNVPVCSLRGSSKSGSVFGFGQLFSSPQKRDSSSSNAGTSSIRAYHHHHQQQQQQQQQSNNSSRSRTDRA